MLSLIILFSLITNTSLAMIWKTFQEYMTFMESLAKKRKCKEDVFYVTFMPTWRHQVHQASDVKEALIERQPRISTPFSLLFCDLFNNCVSWFMCWCLLLCWCLVDFGYAHGSMNICVSWFMCICLLLFVVWLCCAFSA